LIKIELPHDILSLKQQTQRIEKEYPRLEKRKTNNIQKLIHQNHSRFLNRNLKSKNGME
jgi:hypothetical protein